MSVTPERQFGPLGGTIPMRILPAYSFWRHPIKWFRERKHRRYLEKILNYPSTARAREWAKRAILYGGYQHDIPQHFWEKSLLDKLK